MAGTREWQGEALWAKVENAFLWGSTAEAKPLCSLHWQNSSVLLGTFLYCTLLEQHLQPFSWAPGTVPGSCLLTRVHSGFVPHCLGTHRSGTDSPMLLTLKIPLLLHLSWGFFSWKFPPNHPKHPQVILLMNFTSVWPLNLWADSFRTLMEKIVFSVVLQSKIYWVNSSAGYSKLLFKYRECLTHSNVR